MQKRLAYAWWKYPLFWGMWLLLLGPAYIAAFGVWLIGSMLPGYHDPVDIVLTLIFAATLLLIMSIAVYAGWHFVKHSRPFSRLMIWLSAGLLGIPLLSSASALFSYVQLSVN
ncbi:MAG: hypothetical protein R3F02_21630 [Thiolinea sp.]